MRLIFVYAVNNNSVKDTLPVMIYYEIATFSVLLMLIKNSPCKITTPLLIAIVPTDLLLPSNSPEILNEGITLYMNIECSNAMCFIYIH